MAVENVQLSEKMNADRIDVGSVSLSHFCNFSSVTFSIFVGESKLYNGQL